MREKIRDKIRKKIRKKHKKKNIDPMTARALANNTKKRGLSKLKYYCQMCQKQCRDEVKIRIYNIKKRMDLNVILKQNHIKDNYCYLQNHQNSLLKIFQSKTNLNFEKLI